MLWGFLFPMWAPCAWGIWCEHLYLSLLCACGISPYSTILQAYSALHHVSTLHTLFHVASSLHLSVASLFCQSLGHFLSYLLWHGCYFVVSMGQSELRIFLLHHLPQKWKFQSFSFYVSLFFIWISFTSSKIYLISNKADSNFSYYIGNISFPWISLSCTLPFFSGVGGGEDWFLNDL